MAQTTTTSKQFTINLTDIWKGLLVAVITPVLTVVLDSLNSGSLTFDWKHIGITALTAGIAYIIKNFLSTSKIVVHDATPEVVEAVKDGNAEVKVGGVIAPTK